MKATLKFAMLLGAVGVVCGSAQVAHAAVPAAWAEEMSGPVGPNWGAWDDFQGEGVMAGDLVETDAAGTPTPGGGYWQRPLFSGFDSLGNSPSYGMTWIDPGTLEPADVTPAMAAARGTAAASYTAEFRYKVVTPIPAAWGTPDGSFESVDAAWFNVGGGWLNGPSAHDMRVSEGYYNFGDPNFNPSGQWWAVTGENLSGVNPGFQAYQGPGGTTRDVFHTLRVVHDSLAGTQKVYLDGLQLGDTEDTSVGGDQGFTRGLSIGAYNNGGDIFNRYPEVIYDYIRVANGVVEPGTEIGPVPEPATGLMALALCGLGLAARRRV